MTRHQKDVSFDYATIMKDAGTIAASAAAQVGGVDKILDLGTGRVDGRVILDVTVVTVADTDEVHGIIFQVSSSATFASAIKNIATLELNALAVSRGGIDVGGLLGHYELGVCNEYNGTLYRYARLYTHASGTTPGIGYTAHLALKA